MAKVVILGASSGIGREIAKIRLEKGDQVHALARSEDKLSAISDSDAYAYSAFDARDEAALTKCLQDIGEIDHLVLAMNAGSATGHLQSLELSAIRQAFDNKFFPYVNAIISTAGNVNESITFVTGAAARAALPGMGVLSATNSALHALVGVLALELAPKRVNAVSPGVTDTPYWDGVPADHKADFFDTVAQSTPVGRIGTSAEIAAAVDYLIEHGFTTGAILDCDGGARLK